MCKVQGRSAVNPAKTAEVYGLGYGLWFGPKNNVLDESPDPPWVGAIFWEEGPL